MCGRRDCAAWEKQMNTKQSDLIRGSAAVWAVALAAFLCGTAAVAQQTSAADSLAEGESENPHDVRSKDKKAKPSTGSKADMERELDAAEEGNPHSADNRAEMPTPGTATREEVDEAEIGNPHSVDGKDRTTPADVIEMLHASNVSGIEIGLLAQAKGSPRFATFGKTVATDRQAADTKLAAIAEEVGVQLSGTPEDPRAQRMQKNGDKLRERLASLDGDAFDRAFARGMAEQHRRDVRLVQIARATCEQKAYCAVLGKVLPRLQADAETARALLDPVAQGSRAP
jgi:predicted outer membrane protein